MLPRMNIPEYIKDETICSWVRFLAVRCGLWWDLCLVGKWLCTRICTIFCCHCMVPTLSGACHAETTTTTCSAYLPCSVLVY